MGATSRNGQLALFTNTRSYVALTAPGSGITPDLPASSGMTADPAAGLLVAAPDGGYESLASTDMSAALTAGVAALVRSRYPWLTVAEVTQALEHGVTTPPGAAAAGWGRGELDAAAVLSSAAAIAAAHPAPAPSTPLATAPVAQPAATGSAPQAAASPTDPGHLLRSLVVDLAVTAGVLIACLIAAITLIRLRRRARSAKSADLARVVRPGHSAGRARHARRQPGAPTAPVPARVVIWPSRAALPASGSDAGTATWLGTTSSARDSSQAPGTLGGLGGSYRRQRPTGNPPWLPATPPRSPESPR